MQKKINVGVVGGFQNGKSTFVNCMLDDLVARTGGEGVSVTSVNTKYVYGEIQNVEYIKDDKIHSASTLAEFLEKKKFDKGITEIRVSLWKPLLRMVNLVDTPGFNANQDDTEMALNSLNGLDAAIVIINNKGLSQTEKDIIRQLSSRSIPFYVIMNCIDNGGTTWNPYSPNNATILQDIKESIKNSGFTPQKINDEEVIPANFLWFWYASQQYFQDTEEKRRYMLEKIDWYTEKMKKMNKSAKVDRLYFQDNSNLLTIRRFFDSESNWGFPLNCIRWKTMFNELLDTWEQHLKDVLK